MNFDDQTLLRTAMILGEQLTRRGLTLASGESCTAGWIAKAVTDVAGSSAWFQGGVVAYTNEVKAQVLGVREQSLIQHGAVSDQVVREMAIGARTCCIADIAIAVSGVAGPGGGSKEKPVGTVWFGLADEASASADVQRFDGDREAVRRATVMHAMTMILQYLKAQHR